MQREREQCSVRVGEADLRSQPCCRMSSRFTLGVAPRLAASQTEGLESGKSVIGLTAPGGLLPIGSLTSSSPARSPRLLISAGQALESLADVPVAMEMRSMLLQFYHSVFLGEINTEN